MPICTPHQDWHAPPQIAVMTDLRRDVGIGPVVVDPLREPNRDWRTLAYAVAGLALNAAILAVPLLLTGNIARAWRDPAVDIFFLLATAFVVGELTTMRFGPQCKNSATSEADRQARRFAAWTGAALLLTFWAALAEHMLRQGAPQSWQCSDFVWITVGSAMLLVGIALRYAAIHTLRQHFVTEVLVRADQPLVCRGLYRVVRHPSEIGLLLLAVGVCVLLASPLAAAFSLATLLPLIAQRIRQEDSQLAAAFGEQFEAYRRRTRRLVPWVF
ncbi:MAG: isoprenylcysteine carboxylmethyltransferase family protein [Planctomycetia bacterium]|nr:isoprenylcysteine carboxylmethyltransferase family protein [Planctomycetia bacterium]